MSWWGPGNERLRTIEGVDCELQAGFEFLESGSYYPYYENYGYDRGDPQVTVEMFIYQETPGVYAVFWAMGMVALILGGTLILLMRFKG